MNGLGVTNLAKLLQTALLPAAYQGVVGAGSTAESVVDSVGGFAGDQWLNYGIQFTADTPTAALRGVWQKVTGNTGNALAMAAALPAAPVAGDTFVIRSFGTMQENIAQLGGQPVPSPALLGGPVLPTADVSEAPYFSGTTGPIAANNAATQLTVDLGSLATVGRTIFDARAVTVAIANVGTGRTITAASLVLSENVGGQVVTVSYALAGVNVASGAAGLYVAAIDNGLLANAALQLTFSAAPVAGSAAVQVTVHGAGSPHTTVSQSTLGHSVSATQTRPNDTTAYAAGDVVGTAPATLLEFANVTPTMGGVCVILGARLRIDVGAIPAGMSGFRLHLYNAPPTAIVDNAPFNLPAGDRPYYLGYVSLLTVRDLGDTLWLQEDGLNMTATLAADRTTLYGILETIGAFTPTAQAVKTVTLSTAEV